MNSSSILSLKPSSRPGGPVRMPPVRFAPEGLGGFDPWLRTLCKELASVGAADRRIAVEEVLAEVAALDATPALRFRAALSVLIDLLQQGWDVQWFGGLCELLPPSSAVDPQEAKARTRMALQVSANEQLGMDSVKRFLTDLQGDRRFTNLVADGVALRDRLAESGPEVVQPYVQLVESDARDEHSGLRLMDIWRYFRHTWVTPYRSTPGRNLFYLVRDAGGPGHPVMGIAALGNSVIQLTARDEAIGWTSQALLRRVQRADDDEAVRMIVWLLDCVNQGLNAVSTTGLGFRRALLDKDPEEAIRRSEAVAYASSSRRREFLVAEYADGDGDEPTSEPGSTFELFKMKRAAEIASLLKAKTFLLPLLRSRSPKQDLEAALQGDGAGAVAANAALRAVKKTHIGASVMEIIVCGGVAPYNHLLSGKLTALLMCSPQVRRDYAMRYADQPSEIASRMLGKPIARPAELVYLGTTSLYSVGSSQYNRLKVDTDLIGGQAMGSLEFQELGATLGFGSVQFSSRTRDTLEALIERSDGRREIGNKFGEGVSPALRRFRTGLDLLGLDSDRLLRHSQQRIVYGVRLARNADAYLRGEDAEPEYLLPTATTDPDAIAASSRISSFWRTRWLASRLLHPPALERVASSPRALHAVAK